MNFNNRSNPKDSRKFVVYAEGVDVVSQDLRYSLPYANDKVENTYMLNTPQDLQKLQTQNFTQEDLEKKDVQIKLHLFKNIINEKERLKSGLDEIEREKNRLKKENEEYKKQNEKLQKENKELIKKNKKLNSKIRELKEKIKEMEEISNGAVLNLSLEDKKRKLSYFDQVQPMLINEEIRRSVMQYLYYDSIYFDYDFDYKDEEEDLYFEDDEEEEEITQKTGTTNNGYEQQTFNEDTNQNYGWDYLNKENFKLKIACTELKNKNQKLKYENKRLEQKHKNMVKIDKIIYAKKDKSRKSFPEITNQAENEEIKRLKKENEELKKKQDENFALKKFQDNYIEIIRKNETKINRLEEGRPGLEDQLHSLKDGYQEIIDDLKNIEETSNLFNRKYLQKQNLYKENEKPEDFPEITNQAENEEIKRLKKENEELKKKNQDEDTNIEDMNNKLLEQFGVKLLEKEKEIKKSYEEKINKLEQGNKKTEEELLKLKDQIKEDHEKNKKLKELFQPIQENYKKLQEENENLRYQLIEINKNRSEYGILKNKLYEIENQNEVYFDSNNIPKWNKLESKEEIKFEINNNISSGEKLNSKINPIYNINNMNFAIQPPLKDPINKDKINEEAQIDEGIQTKPDESSIKVAYEINNLNQINIIPENPVKKIEKEKNDEIVQTDEDFEIKNSSPNVEKENKENNLMLIAEIKQNLAKEYEERHKKEKEKHNKEIEEKEKIINQLSKKNEELIEKEKENNNKLEMMQKRIKDENATDKKNKELQQENQNKDKQIKDLKENLGKEKLQKEQLKNQLDEMVKKRFKMIDELDEELEHMMSIRVKKTTDDDSLIIKPKAQKIKLSEDKKNKLSIKKSK